MPGPAPAASLPLGTPLHATTGAPSPVAYAPAVRHAGFWVRVGASIIDSFILFFTLVLPGIFLAITIGIAGAGVGMPSRGIELVGNIVGQVFFLGLGWLYEAGMTSSRHQATLGKMALGLKVVEVNGNRLSFGHATGRYFAKLLSSFTLLIGYLMVAFTARKQGLHDMVAGTFVVHR